MSLMGRADGDDEPCVGLVSVADQFCHQCVSQLISCIDPSTRQKCPSDGGGEVAFKKMYFSFA